MGNSGGYTKLLVGPDNVVAPQTMPVTLRYQHEWPISPSSITTVTNFSLNSPYDPVYDVSGGNCTGFSQWMGLYTFCMVRSAHVRFSAHNTSGTVAAFMFAMPVNSSQSVPTVTRDLIMETGYSKWFDIYAGNSGYNPHTMELNYNLTAIEGHALIPWLDYSCTSSADPVKQLVVSLGVSSLDGTTTGMGGVLSAVVTYHCVMWQKRLFGTL